MDKFLTNFDYLILAIIVLSSIFAFLKGFIKTCLSLVSWISSIFVVYYSYPYLNPVFSKYISNSLIASIATLIASYISALLVTSIITSKLADLLKNVTGGAIDRSLGFSFGFARGCLISCIIYLIIFFLQPFMPGVLFSQKMPDWIENSKTYPLLHKTSNFILDHIPRNIPYKLPKNKNKEIIKEKNILEDFIGIELYPKNNYNNIDIEDEEFDELIKNIE